MTERVLNRRYRLTAELGRGGMGAVWRARDERVDRDVAVKILHAWIAEDADARTRFEREARALGQLTHRNIVRLYDFEQSGRSAFLVMELIEGQDLAAAVRGRLPLALGQAARFALPVAEGLAFAHDKGIVHRDLKPANILVDADGRVVISDFGLARIAETTQTLTATGVLMGSPEYWAPEQAAGKSVGRAGDIYSLGCIVYELLTGRLPFEGDDRLAAGYRRVHEDAPDAREHVPTLEPEAAALVGRMLSRDPDKRPGAHELVELFSERKADEEPTRLLAAHRSPLSDPPTAATYPARREARTRRAVLVTLLIAAIAVLAAGIALAIVLTRGSKTVSLLPTSVRTSVRTQTVTREHTVPAGPTVTNNPPTRATTSSAGVGVPSTYVGRFTSVDRLERCNATSTRVYCSAGPSGRAVRLDVGERVTDYGIRGSSDQGGPSMPEGTSFRTPDAKIECNSSSHGITCKDRTTGASFTLGDYKLIVSQGGASPSSPTQASSLYSGYFAAVDRLERCYADDSSAWCTASPSGKGVLLLAGGTAIYEGLTGSTDKGGPAMAIGRSFTTPGGAIVCGSSTRGITCRDVITGHYFTIGDYRVHINNGGGEVVY
jgi:serine/threonine protein kinase